MSDVTAGFRTTLSAGTRAIDGLPLEDVDLDRLEILLTRPQAELGHRSLEQYALDWQETNIVELPHGKKYVFFSGTDRAGHSTYDNAKRYISDSHGTAGIIGDTPYGKSLSHPSFEEKRNLGAYVLGKILDEAGIVPRNRDIEGAFVDSMWNSASPAFARNAVASKANLVAFVDGAPPNRGFTNHELPVLMESKTTRLNGYLIGNISSDPKSFAENSAYEYLSLVERLTGSSSFHGYQMVTPSEVQSKLDLVHGLNADEGTLYGRPIHEFMTQSIGDMKLAGDRWSRVRAAERGDHSFTTPTEHLQKLALPGAHVRDITVPNSGGLSLTPEAGGKSGSGGSGTRPPLGSGDTSPFPDLSGKGSSLHAERVLNFAGRAAFAADGLLTLNRVRDLTATGNTLGTESEVVHFASRNLSAWGGFVLGAEVGALAGIEGGPLLFATGTVGAIAGGMGGNKLAKVVDDYRTFHQTDSKGTEWRMDPEHPDRGWLRTVSRPDPDAPRTPGVGYGAPTYKTETVRATPEVASELNYKASGAQIQLALANPPTPRDPAVLPAQRDDTRSLREADWHRNAQTQEWHRSVTIGRLEHGLPVTRTEIATPERAQRLDQMADAVVQENRANEPHAMADRYLEAHAAYGWDRFGPPEPAAVHASQAHRDAPGVAMENDAVTQAPSLPPLHTQSWPHSQSLSRTQSLSQSHTHSRSQAPSQDPHDAREDDRRIDQRAVPGRDRVEDPHAPQNPLAERLAHMLEAARNNDWDAFRKDTQAFAAMPAGQAMREHSVAMVDLKEQQAELQQAQQAQQQQMQMQQQTQAPSHRLHR